MLAVRRAIVPEFAPWLVQRTASESNRPKISKRGSQRSLATTPNTSLALADRIRWWCARSESLERRNGDDGELCIAHHCMHTYEVRPRKDRCGLDLISDVLPFGRLWYDTPDNAIGYAMHRSRSHHAVICVYDDAANVIETHNHVGDFKEW
jgi:hypothetical protein